MLFDHFINMIFSIIRIFLIFNIVIYVLKITSDIILCNDQSQHWFELRNEIDNRRKPKNSSFDGQHAVMIFFKSRKDLMEFYDSGHLNDIKLETVILTEKTCKKEKEKVFLSATTPGAITLMIREFGRGTDFKCFDSHMLNDGGVHVIQTFFSLDLSEEIQIKGRTARQGDNGSYR